jgi:Bifunctional DNA primase/polymerase, N-terminal
MIGTNQATAEVVDTNTERENGRTELTSWEAAQLYNRAGYEPILLKPNTKEPAVAGWQTAPFKELAMAWRQRSLFETQPGVGLRLSGLVVVDVEGPAKPQAGDPAPFVGTTPVVARTPSGGRHFFYRRDGEVMSRIKALQGVDVLTTGRFVAVSPTAGYAWEDGASKRS